MEDPCKRSLIGIEAMRTLLLAFCTILGQLAPEQLCVPGQLIARRAFHQQCRLFVPDPRLCVTLMSFGDVNGFTPSPSGQRRSVIHHRQ